MSYWIFVFLLCARFANGSPLSITQADKAKFLKEFSVDSLGVTGSIKQDGADILLAAIKVEDMKKIFSSAKSTLVKIEVKLQGIEDQKDGLWKLVVDYELHHEEVELGIVVVERVMEDDEWVTNLTVKCSSQVVKKLIPELEIRVAANYKNKRFTANFKGNGNSLTIYHRIKNPDEKFWKIDLEYKKKNYKFHIDWDLERELDIDFTVNFGTPVDYKVYIQGDDKELTEFEIKLKTRPSSSLLPSSIDPNDLYQLKYRTKPWAYLAISEWKGKYSKDMAAYTAQYKLFNPRVQDQVEGTGQVQLDFQRTSEMVEFERFVFLPYRMMEFDVQFLPKNQPSMKMKLAAQWNIKYLSTMSLDADLTKDGASILTVDLNTMTNPLSFKIVAPGLLSVKSIEVEVDVKPVKYIKLKSNIPGFSSLEIEKTDDKILILKLNGNPLLHAELNKQEATFSDGKKFLYDFVLDSVELYGLTSNKAHFMFDGLDVLIVDNVEWDVTDPSAMVVKIERSGRNQHWGEYEVISKITASYDSSKIDIHWKDFSSFGNSPWPSPVETKVTGHLDFSSYQHDLKIDLTLAGETFTLSL